MEKSKIKKIVLDLGDKEIELSTEQSKKLHRLLDELFGEKTVTVTNPYPIIIERNRPYWRWDIPYSENTCNNDKGQAMFCNDTQTLSLNLKIN